MTGKCAEGMLIDDETEWERTVQELSRICTQFLDANNPGIYDWQMSGIPALSIRVRTQNMQIVYKDRSGKIRVRIHTV